MLKVVAVDDERHALERFERIIAEYDEFFLSGSFDDGDEFLNYIKENIVDVVFLDIEMPETNGLELASEVLNINPDIDIIFVTAFNQYAVEAFEMNALDYIMKPLTLARFQKTMERVCKRRKPSKSTSGKPYIQCFGSFEIILSGAALPFKSEKAKELLAFLVHNKGIPIGWEKIVDALWHENDYEKGHSAFHTTIFRLRKWLTENGIDGILENKRNNYRILINEVDCDIYEFEKADNPARMKELYRGSYMEENGYEWAYPKQAELDLKMYKNI